MAVTVGGNDFPNYLLVRPGETFTWDIPEDKLAWYEYRTTAGTLNGVPVANVSLEYDKEYRYDGDIPLVIAYGYTMSAPYAVMLNEEYAAPLPDAGTVQVIRKKQSTYTSHGRVFFNWVMQGKPVSVFMEWDKLDPHQASVGLGILLAQKGRIQVASVPIDKVSVLLAGPPEVTITLSEGSVSMNWYATGTIPTTIGGA